MEPDTRPRWKRPLLWCRVAWLAAIIATICTIVWPVMVRLGHTTFGDGEYYDSTPVLADSIRGGDIPDDDRVSFIDRIAGYEIEEDKTYIAFIGLTEKGTSPTRYILVVYGRNMTDEMAEYDDKYVIVEGTVVTGGAGLGAKQYISGDDITVSTESSGLEAKGVVFLILLTLGILLTMFGFVGTSRSIEAQGYVAGPLRGAVGRRARSMVMPLGLICALLFCASMFTAIYIESDHFLGESDSYQTVMAHANVGEEVIFFDDRASGDSGVLGQIYWVTGDYDTFFVDTASGLELQEDGTRGEIVSTTLYGDGRGFSEHPATAEGEPVLLKGVVVDEPVGYVGNTYRTVVVTDVLLRTGSAPPAMIGLSLATFIILVVIYFYSLIGHIVLKRWMKKAEFQRQMAAGFGLGGGR